MSTTQPNPKANDVAEHDEGADGMTLRRWYAGMAMAGLSANPERSATFAQDAEDSFTQADAMLAYEQQENGDAA
jgi:hypothetical protein